MVPVPAAGDNRRRRQGHEHHGQEYDERFLHIHSPQ
jgi:hypothetical protein